MKLWSITRSYQSFAASSENECNSTREFFIVFMILAFSLMQTVVITTFQLWQLSRYLKRWKRRRRLNCWIIFFRFHQMTTFDLYIHRCDASHMKTLSKAFRYSLVRILMTLEICFVATSPPSYINMHGLCALWFHHVVFT